MSPEIARRLREREIQVVETSNHYLLVRGDCLALVERTSTGPGSVGSTGILTADGLAFLVSGDDGDRLAAKGRLLPATSEQAETIRAFSADLKSILG